MELDENHKVVEQPMCSHCGNFFCCIDQTKWSKKTVKSSVTKPAT